MTATNSKIETHYHAPDLYNRILDQLRQMDVDLDNVTRKDIAGVDEFHVRGAEVSRELAITANIRNAKLLDVGCGIGGPCRMLADEFNCQTTGIDLSEEFIKTASRLSQLVGLEDKTTFVRADATRLPFKDSKFDVVWTQHVQMNIENKAEFYSEISRVLTTTGIFIYYDIFKKGRGQVQYPMPWASNAEISFLDPAKTMSTIVEKLGLKTIRSKDQTRAGIVFFENLLERMGATGPPKLSLHLLMGASTKNKLINLLNGLKGGQLMLQSGIYQK